MDGKKWFEAFLFGLDDTLIDTQSVFEKQMNQVVDFLEKHLPNTPPDRLKREFEESVAAVHRIHFVNPRKLWWQTIRLVKEGHREITEQTAEACYNILMGIYSILPDFHEGVVETLEALTLAKTRLSLVTHAQKRWTNFKVKKLGLAKYFELVEIANPNKSKTSKVWSAAIKRLDIKAKEAVVVDDNVRGDIQAVREVGVSQLFWVDRKAMWKVYREGKLPSGTKVIREVEEILSQISSEG